jgi:AP-1 complex subunit gamma-1
LDANAVQRHKTTITECLRDQDGVIRRKALDLTIAITNEANIKTIVKELLDYLLTAEADFKDVLVSKVCLVVELFSPNKKWHLDTIIRVLMLAGRFVPEESIATAAHLIAATPELQTYSVHKLYHAVKENSGSLGLVQLAVWAMGEFGASLVQQTVQGPDGVESSVGEAELCDYFGDLMALRPADIIRQYILTALIKLTVRMPGMRGRLVDLINGETTAMSVEIQQRACEYLKLLDAYWDRVRVGLLEPIPSLRLEKGEGQPVADDEDGSKSALNPPKALAKNMLDIDLLLGTDDQPQAQRPDEQPAQPSSTPTLDDIFGSSTPIMNVFQAPPPLSAQPSSPTDSLTLTPMQDDDVVVTMVCTKKDIGNPEITTIEASTRNVSTGPISAFKLQVAVPKHIQLQLSPASSTTMAPGEQVTQTIRLTNSLQGEKALMLKLKCDFQLGSEPRSKQTTVSTFPASY